MSMPSFIFQNFYLDLRRQHQTQDSTPITTRQLESLIRLTEARARLELREVASEQDAQDVVEIMKHRCILVIYSFFLNQFFFHMYMCHNIYTVLGRMVRHSAL